MTAEPAILAEVEFTDEFDAKRWASAFVPILTRVPGRPGRNTKYTRKRVGAILQSLYDGCPDSMAGQSIGISHDTFYEWKKRYPEFSEACERSKSKGLSAILGQVTKSIHGRECTACDDGVMEYVDKNGNDQHMACPACRGSTYAVKPDGNLGLKVVERRVAGYARKDTVQVNHTGTVEVVGSITHTHIQLEGVDPAELQALAWGKPREIEAADVIEAEE